MSVWRRLTLLPAFAAFVAWEVAVFLRTGRKPWRERGRPTCGTVFFGWLGFDVSEYEERS